MGVKAIKFSVLLNKEADTTLLI